MTYDHRKTGLPDEDDPCRHEDYELNWDESATCVECGHRWFLTAKQLQRERALIASYEKEIRKQEWRQWREGWVNRLAFWRRKPKPSPINDEVPF